MKGKVIMHTTKKFKFKTSELNEPMTWFEIVYSTVMISVVAVPLYMLFCGKFSYAIYAGLSLVLILGKLDKHC